MSSPTVPPLHRAPPPHPAVGRKRLSGRDSQVYTQACPSPPGSEQALEGARLWFPASKGQDGGTRP